MSEENKTTVALLAHQARAEHEELHHLLGAVQRQLEGCGKQGRCEAGACSAAALKKLREHLLAHFDREEKGGWLEEAVVRAPHLAHQLAALERQHNPLRDCLARLVGDAEAMDGTEESIEQLRVNFEKFAHKLLKHEANEEHVLQEGFNEDLDIE